MIFFHPCIEGFLSIWLVVWACYIDTYIGKVICLLCDFINMPQWNLLLLYLSFLCLMSLSLVFTTSASLIYFQISGRLFFDSGPRRSTRLAAEAGANQNTSATLFAGYGTNNSSKYLGGSKLSSMAIRSVTVRKGQSWANENYDEGDYSSFCLTNCWLVHQYWHWCWLK